MRNLSALQPVLIIVAILFLEMGEHDLGGSANGTSLNVIREDVDGRGTDNENNQG